jgi:hypothetical protein
MEWQPQYTLAREFLELPYQVYANDPNWIPEYQQGVEKQFSPANRYFEQGNSVWLSFEPNVVRLAGFFNPEFSIEGKKVAFFGFWETINSLAANKRLFADFEKWAKSKGATVFYGPINFSTTFGNYRIRLNHFDKGSFLGEPYNPPYYKKLLESLGYQCQYLYKSDISYDLPKALDDYKKTIAYLRSKLASHFTFISLTRDYWLDNLEEIYRCIDTIFQNNFAYSSLDYESFRELFGQSLANRLFEKASILALDKENKIAGIMITFPDFAPLLRQGATNRIQQENIDYRKHFALLPEPVLGLIKVAGILPQYRRLGHLFVALIADVLQRFISESCYYGACVTYKEGKFSSGIAGEYADETREYGLYCKTIRNQVS